MTTAVSVDDRLEVIGGAGGVLHRLRKQRMLRKAQLGEDAHLVGLATMSSTLGLV